MRRRDVRHRALLAVFATMVGTACLGESGPSSTLRVAIWAGGYELAVEQQVVDLYEAAHPNVRVVLESAPVGYEERLLTSIAAGRPPDVYLMDSPDIPTFVDRGLAVDLAPYAEALDFDGDQVFPPILAAFQRGSSLFAFPKDFTPMVLYVNRAVLADVGVAAPGPEGWTWPEFEAVARLATVDRDEDGTPEVYGFDFPRNLYQWVPFVWSGGGDILGEGGARARGHMDGPLAIEAYRFLTGLVESGVTPSAQFLQQGDPAREARFASGGQAVLLSGHWTLRVFRDMVDEGALDLAIAPIPHRPSQSSATTVLYTSGWAVPPNSPHLRQAIHLAGFLASPIAQRVRARSGLAISSRMDIARAVAREDTTGIEDAFVALVEGARMTWGASVRDFGQIEALSVQIMDRYLLEGDPLEKAAAEVAIQIDRARVR